MDKLEFKPEMFTLIHGGSTDAARSAKEANAILNEWLSSATVVYARPKNDNEFWTNFSDSNDTHKALLINIEPIVKEPCKHEPSSGITTDFYCLHCGVELVAEWKEKGSINE